MAEERKPLLAAGGIRPAKSEKLPSDDDMAKMTWNDLYQLRVKARGNPEAQAAIAPYEHRAYAREEVAKNPLAAPAWVVMPPAYQAAKAAGLTDSDDMSSPASMKQVAQGLIGVAEGVSEGSRRLLRRAAE